MDATTMGCRKREREEEEEEVCAAAPAEQPSDEMDAALALSGMLSSSAAARATSPRDKSRRNSAHERGGCRMDHLQRRRCKGGASAAWARKSPITQKTAGQGMGTAGGRGTGRRGDHFVS